MKRLQSSSLWMAVVFFASTVIACVTINIYFPAAEAKEAAEKIVSWSNIARREGLLGLEAIAEEEPDQFARKGLQLLVDGSEPEEIRHTLEVELDSRERFDLQASKVLEAMGGYSPTIGIIGAVIVTPLMNALRIRDWRARGFAVGVEDGLIGTEGGLGRRRRYRHFAVAGGLVAVGNSAQRDFRRTRSRSRP